MKTLIIYPESTTYQDSAFYILDPETLEEWEKKYGEKTEAKFIDETDYYWGEIYKKNRLLKEDSEK